MTRSPATWLVWLPRVLGIAAALFIGMFALDAFSEGKPLLQALADFAMHLIPAAIVLGVVALAWRYPWVGAVVFIGLGVAYAMSVRRLDWIAVIAGPLWAVGLLFLWSALARHPGRAS
jgi:hypothetical protein